MSSYDDDEELGALIYRSSRTARALQAEAEAEAEGPRKRKRDLRPAPSAKLAVESLPSSPKRARRSRSHDAAAGGTLRRSTRSSRKGTANQVEAKKEADVATRQSDSTSLTSAAPAKASPPKRRRAKYQKHPAIDGGGRRRCAIDGCERPAKAARPYLCREHDSERYQCSIEGCRFRYVRRGLCHRHVEKRFCHVEGCKNQARDKSGACIRHGAKNPRKLCSVSGCSNYRVKSGVCVRHGAMRKKCSRRGCDNMQVNSGVCIRHGAERKCIMHCSHKGCRTTVKSKAALCARHSNRYTQSMRNLDTKLRDALDAVEGQSNTDVEAALFGAMMKISTSVDTFEFTSLCAKKFKDAKAKAKFSFRYRRCRLFTTTSGAIICPKAPRDWKRAKDQSKQELRVLLQLVADYLPGEDKNATKVLLRKLIERKKCPSDLVSRLRNVFDAQQGKSLAEVEGALLTELRKTPNNVNAINICSRWTNRYKDTDKSVKFGLTCPAFWSGPLGFIIQAKGQNWEEAKHQALKEARVLADLFAQSFPQEGEDAIKEMLGRLLERRERNNESQIPTV